MYFITVRVKQKYARPLQSAGLDAALHQYGADMPRPDFGIACGAVAVALLGCPDNRLSNARQLVNEGRYQEAGDAFVALAKADPANLGAWDGAVELWCKKQVNVGQCMGVLDLELKLLGSLQRHRDALSEVLERRARARLAQGLIPSALADLERAEKAAPERAVIHAVRARAHMMRGDRTAMLASLNRAKKLDPKLAEADELYSLVPTSSQADAADGEGFGGPGAADR